MDAVYTLGADDFYMRKRLEIRSLGREPVFLDQIVVDDLELRRRGLAAGRPSGNPSFADDLFIGLEYPGGTARPFTPGASGCPTRLATLPASGPS